MVGPGPWRLDDLHGPDVLGQAQKRRRQLQQRRNQPSTYDAEPAVPPEIRTMVEQGEKIKAIKHYRQLHPGIGLKEAKNVIDGL